MKPLLTLLLFLLIISYASLAQKKFTTEIQFPATLDATKIRLQYNNGKEIKTISPAFHNGKTTLSGSFYSRYATLSVLFPITDSIFHLNNYFIKEGFSSMVFSECRKGDSLGYPFDSCKLVNVIEVRNIPEALKWNTYAQKEKTELDKLRSKHLEQLYSNDSLFQVFREKQRALVEKTSEFIIQNKNKYYTLWLFKRQLLNFFILNDHINLLLETFNQFPVEFRESYEGKEILKQMNGFVNTKKGACAPTFTAKDISGKWFSLSHLRGKYVLLQFWASWCGPCLQEVPMIKRIRETYSPDRLVIIGITMDKDSSAFANAVINFGMNWTHIFHVNDIHKRFGNKPIPSLYLLDEKGIIIFSNWEEKEDKLNSLLNDLLGSDEVHSSFRSGNN